MTESNDQLLTPAELAEYLALPISTIYRWNYHDKGPRRCKIGKHVRYRMTDVQRWLDDQTLITRAG